MNTAVAEVLVLKHAYKCPVDKLFAAWLDPEIVSQFMCPGEVNIARLVWPAKVGGDFIVDMVHEGKTIHHNGRFLEIDRPRRIVYTWNSQFAGEGSQVTLDFAEAGSKDQSLLTLTHERLPSEIAVGQHRDGWNGVMVNLETALKKV